MTADMHMHTVYSDGEFTPEDTVAHAIYAGLGLISITDHDTMTGCGELKKAVRGKALRCVAGIEVSAYEGDIKFHTLGYGVDEVRFQPFLNMLFKNSFLRAEDIIFKLGRAGHKLTLEEVAAQRYSESVPVHGIHFARALLKKGLIKSIKEYFRDLSDLGKPAFSCVGRPTPEEACEAITSAGGLAVIAHPARITMPAPELEKKIKSLIYHGLNGIEVYYTTHTKEQTEYYKNLAESLGLFVTGGSDSHFAGGGRAIGVPRFEPSALLLKRLKIDL